VAAAPSRVLNESCKIREKVVKYGDTAAAARPRDQRMPSSATREPHRLGTFTLDLAEELRDAALPAGECQAAPVRRRAVPSRLAERHSGEAFCGSSRGCGGRRPGGM